jgi:hypothetical protein
MDALNNIMSRLTFLDENVRQLQIRQETRDAGWENTENHQNLENNFNLPNYALNATQPNNHNNEVNASGFRRREILNRINNRHLLNSGTNSPEEIHYQLRQPQTNIQTENIRETNIRPNYNHNHTSLNHQTTYNRSHQEVRNRLNVMPPKPIFSGADEENPALFIRELDVYVSQFPENQQILQAIKCFSGSAINWANGIGAYETDFHNFKEVFIRDFLGPMKQREIRAELESGYYRRSGNTSNMADYFLKMRAKSLRLNYPLTDREFIIKTSLHIPTSIGREIRCYNNSGEESIHLAYQNL